ncbi:MAG TPA: DUF4412 domain-containing protein [Thermoanaerobaculia bacterium]
MRKLTLALVLAGFTAAFVLAAAPGFAGIHYKSVSRTESEGSRARSSDVQAEGWVAADKAKIVFLESHDNPVAQQGTYLLTKDGGRTLYLVNPKDQTYAKWSLQGMLGTIGAVMNGMGPLLKIQFSDLKADKVAEEDGGKILGLPTRHTRFRTTYVASVKVLGMGSTSNVVSEQEVWSTTSLADPGLGVWLRAEPPRTGNTEFDKLITSQAGHIQGYPLKMVTVTTNTAQKGNRTTTTRSTMEVTQIDTSAAVPASTFEIPAGYKETQIEPVEEHP